MKTPSNTYINKEQAQRRQPAELYHFWRAGGAHWRYTSGDRQVVYGGNRYMPAVIERDMTQYNSKLEVSTLTIRIARVAYAVVEYVAMNPVEPIWIEVLKLFRDQSPLEASVVFVGQIQNVRVKGASAEANCVGLEFFLKQPVPIPRYQPPCNHTLFDAKCGLVKATYADTVTIDSVAADELSLVLSGTAFEGRADDYYKLGEFVYGDAKRMIISHTKASRTIQVRYQVRNVVVGGTGTVYPGCDLNAVTCRDKFSNLANFFGMPYIPIDNPVLRST